MDSKYQEQSMLTDRFIEQKFWAWTGLHLISITICIILFFLIRSWEEDDE